MNPKGQLALSMLIFGTIGIFRKFIPLSSGTLAMVRGFLGTAFLLVLLALKGRKPDLPRLRQSWKKLVLSGAFIGLNWILLFESYRYTTVAVATLCYYMAPVLVILASPLVLKERLTSKKALCAAAALAGMVLVSGVLEDKTQAADSAKGILLGLGAALLYACVILMNKTLPPMDSYDKTLVQLLSAALVLLPYDLAAGETALLTAPVVLLVVIVGIVHTGIAYALYFGSMGSLPAQTVALYSYIDPVTAILLSLLIFREQISLLGAVGAVLILGSTLASDLIKE